MFFNVPRAPQQVEHRSSVPSDERKGREERNLISNSREGTMAFSIEYPSGGVVVCVGFLSTEAKVPNVKVLRWV